MALSDATNLVRDELVLPPVDLHGYPMKLAVSTDDA
jgi:hypothetical protein